MLLSELTISCSHTRPCGFSLSTLTLFPSAEHQFQIEKALHFNQPSIVARIRNTTDTYQVKLIGKCKAGPQSNEGPPFGGSLGM